ncbi:MAG: integrin alpha, partial [Thiomicrorhabdus sp.]|nr:integrin alpha [Thiomicrorhabdus sp.]
MKILLSVIFLLATNPSVSKESVWNNLRSVLTTIIDYFDLTMNLLDSSGGAQSGHLFGITLANGDFNNDGWHDLVIGVPGYGALANGVINSGAAVVLYGTDNGLTATGYQILTQELEIGGSDLEPGDRFGLSLVSGNFNGDNFDDLAVGVPYDSFMFNGNQLNGAGAVSIFLGSSDGLSDASVQINRGMNSVGIGIDDSNNFGHSLASGDFNNDDFDDLAVSEPFVDLGPFSELTNAGMVLVYSGTEFGIVPENAIRLHQIFGGAGVDEDFGLV